MPKKQKGTKYKIIGFSFLATYFILQFIKDKYNFGITGNAFKREIVYAINSFISALAVMTFSGLSTLFANESRKKLITRANYDQLTGIYNRYALNKILEDNLKNKAPFHLALADIDFFKKFNDTYGHDVGDEVLKSITDIFVKNVKPNIKVGRWGGEEFLFISNAKISYEDFKESLNNIRKIIEKKEFNLLGNKLKINISIGTGEYKENIKVEKLIKKADDNLYKAKENGRNQLVG